VSHVRTFYRQICGENFSNDSLIDLIHKDNTTVSPRSSKKMCFFVTVADCIHLWLKPWKWSGNQFCAHAYSLTTIEVCKREPVAHGGL